MHEYLCARGSVSVRRLHFTNTYRQVLMRRKIEQLNVSLPEDGADVRPNAYENVM